jgi:hypothetical protein
VVVFQVFTLCGVLGSDILGDIVPASSGGLVWIRWMCKILGGRKCVGYIRWFDGNLVNHSYGREKRG